ncbi:hypothetical protein A1O1_01371 [Capronia coronata CBS 617.96]|uniref:Uncharacterized protein n=1 Tax=Capronia coronata CBS 617.96 TaxID=1182541 RepID=W9Z2Q2_9EURO|nr:uncharacterized protein A1O1_01371 [Capronia coronata CBS 617.96]EXJ96245.1 hypothetical protein A1O1_01371 [Capronia coronata CBS 617.96]
MPSNKPAASESIPIPEPLITRLIIAPVLFVSFLISLFFIDRQTYGNIFGQSGRKDGYYHSNQRKLAKREMDDAFQLRRKVIAALCILGAMSLALVAWGIDSLWTVWRVRA